MLYVRCVLFVVCGWLSLCVVCCLLVVVCCLVCVVCSSSFVFVVGCCLVCMVSRLSRVDCWLCVAVV